MRIKESWLPFQSPAWSRCSTRPTGSACRRSDAPREGGRSLPWRSHPARASAIAMQRYANIESWCSGRQRNNARVRERPRTKRVRHARLETVPPCFSFMMLIPPLETLAGPSPAASRLESMQMYVNYRALASAIVQGKWISRGMSEILRSARLISPYPSSTTFGTIFERSCKLSDSGGAGDG